MSEPTNGATPTRAMRDYLVGLERLRKQLYIGEGRDADRIRDDLDWLWWGLSADERVAVGAGSRFGRKEVTVIGQAEPPRAMNGAGKSEHPGRD